MKLKLCACLVVSAFVTVTQAVAGPIHPGTVILAVDIDAQRGLNAAAAPTEAGFQPWKIVADSDPFDPIYDPATDWNANGGAPNGLTKTFGSITANVVGLTFNGTTAADNRSGRDRGGNSGGFPALYQDFVFAQVFNQASGENFGRNFIKLVLSGLTPGETYEFTGYAREPAFNSVDFTSPTAPSVSFQAWSDLATLSGLDGPAAWIDANVSAGAAYAPAVGGANNPIPHLGRSQVSGPDSLSAADPYYHSASFLTKADGLGKITVYTWSDPNDPQIAQTQAAAVLAGFQLANIPEPTSLLMVVVGMAGLVGFRRQTR